MALLVNKKQKSDAAPATLKIEVANQTKTGEPAVIVRGRGDLVEAFTKQMKASMKGKVSGMTGMGGGGYMMTFKGVKLDELNKIAEALKERIESEMEGNDSVKTKKNDGGTVVKKKGAIKDEDMVPYKCPKCGYEEDFEPGTEPHVCPKCGAEMEPETEEPETEGDSQKVITHRSDSTLVVKRKGLNDAPKKYGDLNPGEASVMFEVSEDGGFGKSSLKLAEGLQKKGYITFSETMGSGPQYTGKLTKKGSQWIKDYEDGKFDATNLGMFGGVGVTLEDDKSVSISNGTDTIRITSKKWAQKLVENLNKAISKM